MFSKEKKGIRPTLKIVYYYKDIQTFAHLLNLKFQSSKWQQLLKLTIHWESLKPLSPSTYCYYKLQERSSAGDKFMYIFFNWKLTPI